MLQQKNYTPPIHTIDHTLFSRLWRPPEMFRNMTLWGCSALEITAVTSVGSSIAERPWLSLPTGQTNGIVRQSRVHWRTLVSKEMED